MHQRIGRYEIKRELGRGAMGVVYLAHDPHLNRDVALKTYTLPDGVTEELARQFRERFLREARAAASLSHPGIVTIHDAGEDPERHLPYIAMEYVEGETLKQRLERQGRLDVSWVAAFGGVLAEALQVAHRAGIVHRDIKPANILIRESDGTVKIADFGVARLKSSDLTQSGAALGSPSYMSPEQVRGQALDGRSDLFTLAVVLYESLCGKRPFKGDDVVSLALSIAQDTQVPLSRQSHGLPLALDAFFDRALAKEPDQRYPDGAAFRGAFLKAARSVPANPTTRTAMDASTVAMAPPVARGAQAAGAGASTVAMPVARAGGRGRTIGLAFGAAVLVAGGIAAAAWLGRGGQALTRNAGGNAASPAPAMASAGDPMAAPPVGTAPTKPDATTLRAATPPPPPAEMEPPRMAPAPATIPRQEVTPVVRPTVKPRYPRVTVPAGTELHLSLDRTVGSATSHAGEALTGRLTDAVIVGDRVVIPAGSTLHGTVSAVVPATKGLSDKAGLVTLAFDKVVTPYGFRASISASLTSTGASSAGKSTAVIGGGAAGGAVLGRILGRRSKSSAVGSALGGAIGTAVVAGMKGAEAEIPAGSPVTVRLDQPFAIDVAP